MRDEIERLRRMIDDTRLFKVVNMNIKAGHPEYVHGPSTTLTLEIYVDEREMRGRRSSPKYDPRRSDPRVEMVDVDGLKALMAVSEASRIYTGEDEDEKRFRREVMGEFVAAPKGVKIKKEPKPPSFVELLKDV